MDTVLYCTICYAEEEYIGFKDGLHWYECKACHEREGLKDPQHVSEHETARLDPRYKLGGVMGPGIYRGGKK